MGERVLTVGASRASRPISDFLMVNDYQGPKAGTYYVDLNVAATGAGSPDHPFATIAEAITASNTSIGLTANRWWARRNRIYVCGDGITESLTVLPEKCDIIGCGSDLYPFPRVIGRHTIAAAAVGCRFISMGFQANSATDLMTIPAACHGLQFLDCLFIPKSGGTTVGLGITDTACMKISGCTFQIGGGAMATIFGTAISLLGTIGHECEISFNKITATVGILTATALVALGSWCNDNFIHATGLTINDIAQDYYVVNNRLITDVDIDADTTLGVVCKPELACGNIVTGSGTAGTSDWYPWAKTAA
jgi:hypothetical protein